MKSFGRIVSGLALAAAVVAPVTAVAQTEDEPFYLEAVIRFTEGGSAEKVERTYVRDEKGGTITYFRGPNGGTPYTIEVDNVVGVGYYPDGELNDARDAFEMRKFRVAAKAFAPLVKRYEPYKGMPMSPYTEIAYKHVFSLQESGQYDEAMTAWSELDKSLLSDYQKGMISTVPAWVAFQKKEWDRLVTVCEGLKETEKMLPLGADVRISYLLGYGYNRGSKKDAKRALFEFHRAMTLDAAESEEIVYDAAIEALKIYERDEQVKEYFLLEGRPEFNPNAGYTIPARSAAWIAKMVDSQKPAGKSLPADYLRFLDVYKSFAAEPTEEAAADGE
ncbi:hypothetical protein [Sulfuriroseicoccus oceanibius]|uniref:Uncharacterized protein n=1 Tax=Sulfuriroseicoccus oceanibius TaxID=2707525 RepID=A0A6B3L241_9BACT|nr:hypothetical protein [Sulfuriroseicoccus oceanibius]QQL44206.1 hypothetical protein G3M56_009900 [Sulfuriroseicoccus oceanibius]